MCALVGQYSVSYREKLFDEELIHLRRDEYAEFNNKDTELVKMLDAKELSPVFRLCNATALVLK